MEVLKGFIPHRLARMTLVAFLIQIFSLLGLPVIQMFPDVHWSTSLCYLTVYFMFFTLVGKLCETDQQDDFGHWWRASVCGFVLATGIYVASCQPSLDIFGWYMVIMGFFHFSEYWATALTNPCNLSTDSFLLNHSPAYHVAAILSWLEFFLEWHFYPPLKSITLISLVGLIPVLGGEILRKVAMVQAGRSFSHIVQTEKKEDHKLVTTGVFGLMRHPSYVGWFYWSIGTQVVLCNPFCFVAYLLASWLFFHERIRLEEQTLLGFFEEQYEEYKAKVPSGLPCINGYPLDEDEH